MQSNRTNWLIAASVMALLGAAVVTLRAAETSRVRTGAVAKSVAVGESSLTRSATSSAPAGANRAPLAGSAKQHPPASAPEESATIKDDPTTAPDPSQSADNNVSFPTDI
jgi:hypothetical protein